MPALYIACVLAACILVNKRTKPNLFIIGGSKPLSLQLCHGYYETAITCECTIVPLLW